MTRALAALGVATLASGLVVIGAAGAAQADSSEPEGNRVPVTICHKNQGAKGYVVQTVDASSIVSQGHTQHQDGQDIIPPFTWWEKVGSGASATWVSHDEAGQNTDKLSWIETGCKPPKPGDARETRDLPGVLDCHADTVTVEHQERTLTHSWNGEEWVATWSDWATFDTTVTAPTGQQCPSDRDERCPGGDHNGVEPGCGTPPTPQPATDVCKNIAGEQSEVPAGYSERNGVCTKDTPENAGTEKPNKAAKPELPVEVAGTEAAQPDEVAGTPQSVPTAVAAGLGASSRTDVATVSPVGAGLAAAGLLMLVLAGITWFGRSGRGAHQV